MIKYFSGNIRSHWDDIQSGHDEGYDVQRMRHQHRLELRHSQDPLLLHDRTQEQEIQIQTANESNTRDLRGNLERREESHGLCRQDRGKRQKK